MEMKGKSQGELNGSKSSLGVILILFILAVVVSRVYDRTARAEFLQQGNSIEIASSQGFNVYNESVFTLTTTTISGDFERKPDPHIILPGGSYGYQVSTSLYKNSLASVYYSYEYREAGQTRTGIFILDMIANTAALPGATSYMRFYTTGPINFYRRDNYSTSVWIRS
ncbi:hypothetical protein M3223_14720 [Paenibacillus pasadenensis]|uniref:hypothetical protein n=1 Tax=Paenibacillus pasadenensis TaxID=217090 RepID=UPI00203E1823|nr:hypothetical protein [Paenibacillus pasadenensis]MCM3748602.1 hypothetical protein [Paenibacillus pasadenensis]